MKIEYRWLKRSIINSKTWLSSEGVKEFNMVEEIEKHSTTKILIRSSKIVLDLLETPAEFS